MNHHASVECRNVSFCYEGQEKAVALKHVDLSIQPGTFVSIIGHNGSGKSTLAKLMNALLVPSDGVVIVCGFETRDEQMVWEIRRQVGMVFQNPDNQIVGTTVEDDVAFGLENLGVAPAEIRSRTEEALRSVQMDGYASHQPHRLSGGQKQRIAIAGIIAMRPSVIIFDEATAMLDPQGRKEVLSLAHRLHREEGITVINITHFPEETLQSDRVIVMHEGEVYDDGTPEQVYSDVKRLREIGLEVPFAVRVREELGKRGVSLPFVLDQEELVKELCKLLSKM